MLSTGLDTDLPKENSLRTGCHALSLTRAKMHGTEPFERPFLLVSLPGLEKCPTRLRKTGCSKKLHYLSTLRPTAKMLGLEVPPSLLACGTNGRSGTALGNSALSPAA